MTETIAEQINLLKRGTVEVFTETELAQKLAISATSGKQCIRIQQEELIPIL